MLPLVVTVLIALSDQWTKAVVRASFALGESRPVVDGFFSLTYVRNTGAAWGILGGQNTSLTILSVLMLLVMVIFRRSFLGNTRTHRFALGLMMGGIVGNLLDRVRLGWVTDFFDFFMGGWHWPAFNIADAAICAGVGIYIISAFWDAQHPLNDRREDTPKKAESAG
ncbi:MAG: signal peptidase II [Kiritimatiellae bacterium]|nr:signal peptidase II [Kiritimatiellia bacterium]